MVLFKQARCTSAGIDSSVPRWDVQRVTFARTKERTAVGENSGVGWRRGPSRRESAAGTAGLYVYDDAKEEQETVDGMHAGSGSSSWRRLQRSPVVGCHVRRQLVCVCRACDAKVDQALAPAL